MDFKYIANKIIRLPHSFYKLGNRSIYTLLEDTGYFLIHDYITVEDIIKELNDYVKAINDWLIWSADKKAISGWYFKLDDNGLYVVGFFSSDKTTELKFYTDEKLACASFIKLEVESIRENGLK